MPKLSPNAAGALIALAAFAVFASHDALIKRLAGQYSPVQIVFSIAVFTFPMLLVMIAANRQPFTLIPRNPLLVVLRGIFGATAATLAFYAFSVLPMAEVYVLLFATPLLVTLLAVPFLGEKVGPRRVAAVIVGLLGVLIVLRPGSSALSLGHAAGLASAMLASCSAIIMRRVGRAERSEVLLLTVLMANFVLMGAGMPFVYVPMAGPDMAVMILVAVMAFTAMQLNIQAYRRAEAVVVAPMQYSQILWAILYGMLFFDEVPDVATLVGAGVVMSSGIYILFREARRSGS